MTDTDLPVYSCKEEIANSITHGLGALFGIVVIALLVTRNAMLGDALRVVTFAVYGGSIVVLFSASALYHGIQKTGIKRYLRLFDHSAIFLLIAGTYTPFCLIALKGGWGWTLFGLQWGCAALGILLTLLQLKSFKKIEVVFYVAMGWMAIIAIGPLVKVVPAGAVVWIVGGGLTYTIGVVFYKWKRLPFNHAIWHLFVLAGAALHFVGILLYYGWPETIAA